MTEDDKIDSQGLGEIGTLSDEMTTEALFWRLVCNLRLSLKEVDSWTLDEMRKAGAFLSMQNDYKRAISAYSDVKKDENQEDEAEEILAQSRKGKGR